MMAAAKAAKLTKPQEKALALAKAALENPRYTKHGSLITGANVHALCSLREIGRINFSTVFLRGLVRDLEIL